MDPRVVEVIKRVATVLGVSARHVDGRVIPAPYLRLCGSEFRDDRYFLDSARREADRMISDLGVHRGSAVLDVGCGFGRLAIGLVDRLPDLRRYEGVDVSAAAIGWCRRYVGRRHPNFHFTHIDVRNARYNPGGRAAATTLPFDDGSFDVAYLYSVFSHMELPDVIAYLAELRRVVRTGGRLFVTFHVAEEGPEVDTNPADAGRAWKGPLHCVRYRREAIEQRFRDAGFDVQSVSHGTETDGQSGYVFRAF